MSNTTANTQPIFMGSVINKTIILNTNTLTRNGVTGTPTLIVTAGENGAVIENIYAIPLGDETQNVIRLFKGSGSGYQLIRELDHGANSGSTNTAAQAVRTFALPAVFHPTGGTALRLEADQSLFAALGTAAVAGGFALTAIGGQY